MLPYYAQDVDVGVRRMPSAHLQRRDYDNDRLAGLANSATWKARISESKTEPSRVSRRLPCLRGWGHDESEPVFSEVRQRAVRMVFEHAQATRPALRGQSMDQGAERETSDRGRISRAAP